MIVLVDASASAADAVMPTVVPAAAFSLALSLAALTSVIAPTLNSSTSVRLIVKLWVEKLPSAEVARMVMLCEGAAS